MAVSAAPDPTQTSQTALKLACLRVGKEHYALDIMCIKEIIRPLPIVAVPRAQAFVDGVINLRKAVIPVVDLRRRFGLEKASEDEKRRRIVICSLDKRIVGLLVDEVTEVVSCGAADLRPTPYYLSGAEAEFFPAVCRINDQLMMLVDPRKLLASDNRIDLRKIRQAAGIDD